MSIKTDVLRAHHWEDDPPDSIAMLPGPTERLPQQFQARVDQWMESNEQTPSRLRHGVFPLGMVQRWIERAEAAEEELKSVFRSGEIPNRRNFSDELTCLLNKYSKENGSNTPDFILAEYLAQCLEAWNLAVRAREEWYGRQFSSGSIQFAVDAPAPGG